MILRRPRVPQRRDETLASLGRVTQRDVMARGLRFNPRNTPRPTIAAPSCFPVPAHDAVGSHGSGGALPLQWWAAQLVPFYQAMHRAGLARHPRLRRLVPLAVVEHKLAQSVVIV
jgi:hypothetical protein